MKRFVLALCLIPLLSPLLTEQALAHAALLRATPAKGGKVASPEHIVLRFSEALEPAFSGAILLDADGRNVTGAPVKVDGPLMTLTPGPLTPGVYRLNWHSVGHDTHRVEGEFSFTVKP